jgi:RNA polymerase sigma-70 factor (family 1)
LKNNKADILELWHRIANDDDDTAFETFFHLFNNALIRFCIMYVHRREVAEEIVSDIFVKCWLNKKTLHSIQSPDTYLFVAVKNQSLNYLKKYSPIHLVQIDDTNEVKFINTHNPQAEYEKKELIFKLDQAIDALPQQCRIVFRLIKEDGMKYKEVAEILNISHRTVQTQLFRALKKLNTTLYSYHHSKTPVS